MADTTQLKYATLNEIDAIHATLRQSFRAGKAETNHDRFKEAFAADLGRPALETALLILPSGDCKIAYDGVEKWARTEKAPFSLNFFPMRPVIRKEPKGVVLSISPFNYPVWLALGPMGNCFVLKPSELSPALVPKYLDPDVTTRCDLQTAAKRIMWGKCVNAGQTCVAPDYILVPEDAQDKVSSGPQSNVHDEFYPTGPSTAGVFGRIVNLLPTFRRLKGLLDRSAGEIAFGGETNENDKYISPTIVKNVKGDDSLMSEELFGPILPIVPVKNVDEAIAFINDRDNPLTLYVFSQDAAFKAKVFDNTLSGSAVANDTLVHCAVDGLPFGGIGPSGSGYHTRKYTFDLFTHLRSSLDSPAWVDAIFGSRFPPYTAKKESFPQVTPWCQVTSPSTPACQWDRPGRQRQLGP
ncbi:NAD-aldehyde dehydrogenase [Pisolithus croceorrhizus]|nr:NAD-aldehyde dehydrogenase [Pisolithus croceorrhizus]